MTAVQRGRHAFAERAERFFFRLLRFGGDRRRQGAMLVVGVQILADFLFGTAVPQRDFGFTLLLRQEP